MKTGSLGTSTDGAVEQWSPASSRGVLPEELNVATAHLVDVGGESSEWKVQCFWHLKLVMYGEALREEIVELVQADGTVTKEKIRVTPDEILRKMLDDKLYDMVREVLMLSKERKLFEYELPV